jgi:hypothetical protein
MAEKWSEGARLDLLAEVLWTAPQMPNLAVQFRRDCVDLLDPEREHALAVLCPTTRHYVSVYVLPKAMKPEADGNRAVGYNGPPVTFAIADRPNVGPNRQVEVVGVEEGRKRIRDIAFAARASTR